MRTMSDENNSESGQLLIHELTRGHLMATAAGQAQHFTPVTLLLGHTDQLAPVVGTEFGVITLPSRRGWVTKNLRSADVVVASTARCLQISQ